MNESESAQTLIRLLSSSGLLEKDQVAQALEVTTEPPVCRILLRAFERDSIEGAHYVLRALL